MEAEEDAERRQRRWWTGRSWGLEPETAGTATERVAVARQRTVDESGITDCVSSFVVRLVVVLLAVLSDRVSLAAQFVACCCVVSVWLLSVCCSSIRSVVLHCFCCRFIWCGCAHVKILFSWSFGSHVSVGLVWRGLVVERRL